MHVPLPISEYEAVAGGEAYLPCNFTLPSDPELVSLMLWYRDQERVPIYTLDFRKGTRDNPKHFPVAAYAERSYFDVSKTPPTIRLDSVSIEDEGYYRCNIEFRRSRTVVRIVKLNIIIPSRSVLIMDDRGQRLKGLAGPYDEGAYLALLCEADGGSPSPSVTWWRNKSLLDDTFNQASQSYIRNELVILELRRSDLLVELTCQASNTNLTKPLSESIQIDLNLRPLYVRITTLHRPLKAGDELRLNCETSGSRPPAKISWWLDNKRIQSGKESIPNSRNITYSSLTLRPGVDDNGKMVVCKAENPALQHAVMQDTWYLNVHFPPEVYLQLGANIKYSTIKEGNDVYLECTIRSNPPVTELIWLFEGRNFYGNSSVGIIISNQSLVLQKVKKEHRGRYRCIATNSEGEGESSDLFLEVRYAPTCKSGQRDLYGVAREETVNISCEVDSDPSDVTFRWTLNNSIESTELHNFKSNGPLSVITYTPKTMGDYGSLLCWGRNSVAEQKEPCFVRIIPAGPPDPVRNCVVVNQSHSWLLVECEAGYSNGLQQKFHLDVYNSAVDHLQVNLTSNDVPSFSVHDLPPGTPFVLVVYASNEKGKSNSLAIVGHTLQTPLLQADTAFMAKLSPLVAILLAVVGTLLMIGVVGLAFVQIRKRRPIKASIEENKSKMDVIFKKTVEDLAETAIACPDVVPPNNTVYVSPDGESICELPKDTENIKGNCRNCVVALKRSWSFKKGHQEKAEVEVTLPDLNSVLAMPSDSPSTTLLGDMIIEENLTPKKIVIKVEQPPESVLKSKIGK
ncbi:nephrin-like [Stegodyphus dumicola]|uniref:nephrin-like n=1 Tax=Stegodyphus dumicola TaxID=202533 RepID=UPI0015AFD721|nr:nephrin-like [Stegodyphus dumicola]